MTERIRLRAVATGLLLGLILCVVTPYNNAYLGNVSLGGGHFPLASFFITTWIFALTALWSRFTRRQGVFNGMELLVIWVLMVLVSGISYAGLVETFFINITAPKYFAKDAFRWAEFLNPLLPQSWYPQNMEAVNTLYNGLDEGRQLGWLEVLSRIPWEAWITPLLTWGFFILVSFFVMICLVNLFGRQWVVNERVNFPLLRVPQLMGEAVDGRRAHSFLTDRYLVMGLLMAGLLQLVNGLHFYYPDVPQIPTLILAGPYFPKYGLFSGFHKLKLYIYPAFIGFAFLTTRQISFSFWFFYIVGSLALGVIYVMGFQYPEGALGNVFGPDLSRPEEAQTIGSYLIFFIFLVWLARNHLAEQLRCSLKASCLMGKGLSTSGEGEETFKATPWSFWGFAVGTVILVLWCLNFGLSMAASLLLPLAFFMVLIVASRIICQGGLPYFALTAAPMDGLMGAFGTGFFGKAGLAAAAVMQKVLFLDLRETVMPTLFHSTKISERIKNRGLLYGAIVVTLVLSVALSFVTMLALCYKFGIRELRMDWATTSTLSVYENAQRLIDTPVETNWLLLSFAGLGALVMLVLVLLYYKASWWNIHPIGYLVAYGASMKVLWFCFFLGWLSNHLCLHYGGTSLYNRLRFLFIGLILGDFLMGGIWAVVGLFSGSSFNVFPS